jgi:hypothetical protein
MDFAAETYRYTIIIKIDIGGVKSVFPLWGDKNGQWFESKRMELHAAVRVDISLQPLPAFPLLPFTLQKPLAGGVAGVRR